MITPSFALTATERVLPRMALDFTTASLDSSVTFTRAGNTATRVNSSGALETINANLPRFDFDPATLVCKGLLIEESRINKVVNNTMQGAVVGTPGTIPTNWGKSNNAGITSSVDAIGTDNGISYIDIKLTGTASAASTFAVYFGQSSDTPALTGQTWSTSCYWKLQSGSLTGLSGYTFRFYEYSSAFGFVDATSITIAQPTSASLIQQPRSITATLKGGATTAYVNSSISINIANGATLNFTLRIGMPQLELGAFSTSIIPTSGSAVTRNADVAVMTSTNFSSWYTATSGAAVVWAIPKTATGTRPLIQFDDTTANEIIALRGNVANPELYIIDGGAPQAQIDAGTIVANTAYKLSGAWNTDSCAAAQNGAAAVTDNTATIPTPTQLRIGSDGTNYASAWIQEIMYWPQRIIDAEVQAFSK